MKHKSFKQVYLQLFTLVTLCFTAFGFTTKVGLDSYEIYLNNKLILHQFVNQPLDLRKLQLNQTNDKDELRIYYKHCNQKEAGTSRSIVIKDQKGNTLKKWAFADASGSNNAMVLSVKELRQLEKNHAQQELSLHYLAQELPKSEMLASFRLQ